MGLSRDEVQSALAYFLALCVITSEEDDEEAIRLRYNFIVMSAIRCHLFDDTDEEICSNIVFLARDIVMFALERDDVVAESEKQANILAVSGFAKTAIASILDYAIYFDELDSMRSQIILDICRAAGLEVKETVSTMAPAFNAIYRHWE